MRKPLIGLVGRRRAGSRIGGFPPVFAEVEVDLFIAHYAHAVNAAGGIAIYLPLDSDPGDLASRLDGLLLTGGEDIASCLYAENFAAKADGEAAQPEIEAQLAVAASGALPANSSPASGCEDSAAETHQLAEADPNAAADHVPLRDAFELALLDVALATELPVLGICRGVQLLTVAAGGTLHQHLPTHAFVDGPPDATPHIVTTTDGSELRQMYGPEVAVNSLHHQAADTLGDGYVATAHSPDGIIEGIEHTELPIVAVQWHPELMTDALADPCFNWLVEHAINSVTN